MTDGDFDAPVLFAGGGLVGLSTAMFLAQHDIASLAVEGLRAQRARVSPACRSSCTRSA